MKIVNLIPRPPRRASVLPSADMHVAGGSGVIAGRGEPGTVGGEQMGICGSNVTPMRSRAALFLAIGALIGAGGCASAPKIDPLTVRQIEPAQAAPADPTMALISGRLLIAEDGKSKVPYESGTDAGCVAGTTAALVVLIPLIIFLGGAPSVAGGPDCENYLPTMTLVQLESRRAAALVVAEDGRFQAQVPPGTYLVQGVTDDRTPLSVAMAFQGRRQEMECLSRQHRSRARREGHASADGDGVFGRAAESRGTGCLIRPAPERDRGKMGDSNCGEAQMVL